MSTWQAILDCVYNDDFETLERTIDLYPDAPIKASLVIAREMGNQLNKSYYPFSGVMESLKYFMDSPYLDRTSFTSAVGRELVLINNPELTKKYTDVINNYGKTVEI